MAEGKISLSLGKKPPPTNGVKRSHAALREDDDEALDAGRAQKVSHFDKEAGGAVTETKKAEEGPLIIAPQKNRDWREASKRRRGLPAEAQQSVNEEAIRAAEARKPGFGLNVTMQRSRDDKLLVNGHDIQAEAEASEQEIPPEPDGEASVKAKTDDELALDALLGRTQKSELLIPAATEGEAFENDYRSAPEMASLDDYARVPVEQFGTALLRGMGWKEGQGIGSQKGKAVVKAKPIERRPALLGIGAKEEAAVKEEMGAWGKAANKKGAQVYAPVMIRDKHTGETYTEEELQKKCEADEKRKYEDEFDRKECEKKKRRSREDESDRDERRNGHKDSDRERRHRRDDYNDRNEKRHKDDRNRRRHRDDDSEDEDEYRRRKEKERRRRERERDDSDYDRERSRRHDSDRDRRRNRSRDRRR